MSKSLNIQILCVCVLLCVASISYSQSNILENSFSLPKQRRTSIETLKEITALTGYNFIYNSAIIKIDRTIKHLPEQAPLSTFLDSIFADTTMAYSVIDKYIIVSKKRKDFRPQNLINDSVLIIRGKITDIQTNQPLAYASISITKTDMATVANEDGEFSFKLPISYTETSLAISYIGYKGFSIPTKQLTENIVTIPLERDIVSLQEVIIRNPDPLALIKAALGKLDLNYPSKACIMTGYYREAIKNRQEYLIVSEAVLDIYKPNFRNQTENDQIKILKSRKFVNMGRIDTVIVKIKAGLDFCLTMDMIKNIPDFLSDEAMPDYKFGHPDIVKYNNELVYSIPFQQKENITEPYYCGQLYINQTSLAITGAAFEVTPQYIGKIKDDILVQKKGRQIPIPTRIAYIISYRPVNNKYFLSHTRYEMDFKIRKRRHLLAKNFQMFFELATSNIDTVDVKRFPRKETDLGSGIFADAIGQYAENFWGTQNTIQPEQSLEQALIKISERLEENKKNNLKPK